MDVMHLDSELVNRVLAKGGPLVKPGESNYSVAAVNRSTPSIPELHRRDTDIFYVLDGSSNFVTGGTLVKPHETAPDELRGTAISGGDVRTLSKGDLLVVPPNTPHWIREVSGILVYLVTKVR